jgi:peptide-methionine (S)-S-oxide reductase
MSTSNGPSSRKRLPVKPSEEHLKKQAKRRAKLEGVRLADAQHRLAVEYGSRDWAELMHVVETMLRGADQLSDVKYDMEALPQAANAGDLERVRAILSTGAFTQHDLDLALARSVLSFSTRGQIARLLLEHGADPDGQYGSGYGPIIFGTGESLDVEGLEFLIAAGADVTFAPVDTKYGRQCPLSCWLGTYLRGRNDAKHRGIEVLLRHGAYVPPEVTPPLLAIHRGQADALGAMIDADRSLVRRTFRDVPYGNIGLNGATLLHCAVEFGEIGCIDAILSRYRGHGDLDMNSKAEVIDGIGGQTPIYHAINTNNDGNLPVLKYLIHRAGQWIDMSVRATWHSFGQPQATPLTPLEYAEKAAREIDPKWAQFRPRVANELALLRPLDRRAALRRALGAGDVPAATRLLDESPEMLTPEAWPASYATKSVEITRLLLDRGLDPNVSSAPRRAIDLAAYHALPDVVELLIERGADVTSRNRLGETPMDLLEAYEPRPVGDPDARRVREALLKAGATHDIHSAVRAGDVDEVRRMLDADPAKLRTPEPWNPLFTAARAGRLEVARLLLDRGAPVDDANASGNTPLWFACQSSANAEDRIAVATLLLDRGANPRRDCEDKSTPLHFAAWRGPREMVELLIRHNAKTWQADKEGKLPIDYARTGVAADRDAIVHLLDRPVIDEPNFRAAVNAIHAGDLTALTQLLADHPNLSRDRAVEPACYLSTDYFGSPKLLWFVAINPTLIKTMPSNIVDLAKAIIDAGVEQHDLDYTLGLVMTSDPAKDQQLQTPLMELLLARGATVTDDAVNGTLAHAIVEPVQVLLKRGYLMTAPVASALGKVDELKRLLKKLLPSGVAAKSIPDSGRESPRPARNVDDRLHAAFSLAVIHRQVDCASACLDADADVNAFLIVHTHSTPAHQAAVNDDVPMLELLVSRGARLDVKDKLWGGTPLGWAIHQKKPAAVAYLRSLGTA